MLYWSYYPHRLRDSLSPVCVFSKIACFAGSAQTLPDAIPPIGRIHLFSKNDITSEPIMPFWCHFRFILSQSCTTYHFYIVFDFSVLVRWILISYLTFQCLGAQKKYFWTCAVFNNNRAHQQLDEVKHFSLNRAIILWYNYSMSFHFTLYT